MDFLSANQRGTPRQVEFDGRPHLVVPMRMIVSGVLPGSDGPLYYPTSELERSAARWNAVPVTVGHPRGPDGALISAQSPGVPVIGRVFSANFRAGGLEAEAWLDIEESNRLAPGLIDRAMRGWQIEISTGLHTRKERRVGVANGRAYDGIARDHQPDHLAVLLNERGACGLVDGCGLNVANAIEPLASPIPQGIGYAPPATFGPMRMPELFPDTEHAGCRCGG